MKPKVITQRERDHTEATGPRPISAKLEGDELVLRMPLQEPTLSRTGKTMVVASTMGALHTDVSFGGARLIVNANAYFKTGNPDWKQAAQASLARMEGRLK